MTTTVRETTTTDNTAEAEARSEIFFAPDTAASRYLFAGTAFLALGALLWLAAIASMRFPGLLPLSFGHLRAMALIVLFLGWMVLGLAAAIFYLLPRLTAIPLQLEKQLNLALPLAVTVVVVAVAVVGLGFGDGGEPFSLPWWWDLPVLAVTALPLGPTLLTIRARREGMVYPSLWFAAAAVIWLPLLYLIGNLPQVSSLAHALGNLVFTAGFLNVWGVGLAMGAVYYVVPKASGQPLASRQLAKVGYWSLLFGAIWMGPAQLVAGPQPEWLQAIAAVLGLALPLSAVANATNLALTVKDRWPAGNPIVLAAVTGSGVIALASLAASFASFRSSAVLVGFTLFWEGIYVLFLTGIALLFAAFAWQAIPNLVGRALASTERALGVVRLVAISGTATGILLALSGLITGVAWSGAGFTGAFENVGAGWLESAGLPGIFTGLAVLGGLLLTWGLLGLAVSVYRSLTSGKATVQEVLVIRKP
ncbi:MAG TPA: cbb3-type cytochrome c oxidase subunit I [Acidimicrobiia bacterium]|nr:cbb3-type cytochrome c oxidase subunit I [Acidimicrobiia bacterium]